jgi:branched-chain amino acid transport system ATP-binding protein
MLEIRHLEVWYGPIAAVRGIDLSVQEGEIVALIGANGAGKSTIVKAIAGLLPFRGEVVYAGRRLRPGHVEANVRAGLALVPEGRGILGRMSVQENLLMGAYCRSDSRDVTAELAAVLRQFPVLAERRSMPGGLLSGGEQQMLAIARALLSKPRLLMLDEPSLGLSPKMTDQVFELIAGLRRRGLSVLLVEQKARKTLRIADRVYLIETGRVVRSGAAVDLADEGVLSDVFLGGHAPRSLRQEDRS